MQKVPAVSLQAKTGAPIIGPSIRLKAAVDWPNPLTVPLVAGCKELLVTQIWLLKCLTRVELLISTITLVIVIILEKRN